MVSTAVEELKNWFWRLSTIECNEINRRQTRHELKDAGSSVSLFNLDDVQFLICF